MSAPVTDTPNLYLNLAIKYYERAEKAGSPALGPSIERWRVNTVIRRYA
jgi:hypothetical protein